MADLTLAMHFARAGMGYTGAWFLMVMGDNGRALLGDGGHWSVVDYPWTEVARVA